MSTAKVCSSRSRRELLPHSPTGILTEFSKRCRQVRKLPAHALPSKIESLLKSFESTSEEQAAAADHCCCPLCMLLMFDGGSAPHDACSICQRRCCHVCSFRVADSVVCRSQTCSAISKFNSCQFSLQELAVECERISRDLLCQWVVLQLKGELQLGPLRALILVDARNAALRSLAANDTTAAALGAGDMN